MNVKIRPHEQTTDDEQAVSRHANPQPAQEESEAFILFVLLRAGAIIVHQLRQAVAPNWLDLTLYMVAVALLLWPTNLRLFWLTALVQAVDAWQKIELGSNHWFLVAFLNATALLVGLRLLLSPQRAEIVQANVRAAGRYVATLTPLLRLAVLILYVWSAVHKLNGSFFDPLVSCAVWITEYRGLGTIPGSSYRRLWPQCSSGVPSSWKPLCRCCSWSSPRDGWALAWGSPFMWCWVSSTSMTSPLS
ncbi:MAG: hypothetical protein AAF702_37910 [Chloroflexota bacterium]